MKDDAELLRLYAVEGAQDAFSELVRRHLGLVYHAALRQAGGDPHRAEEIAQLVFTEVARQAAALSRRPLLVAWLHTTVRYTASHQRRTELRRLVREHAAFAMNADEAGSAPEAAADWERLRPLIDDALQTLGERDRAAVLLRFFENRSYADVATALSVSEDAARVRTNRALEKLRSALARRGLVSTASALSLALVQPALAATPPGLAASITSASLSAAATAATTGATVGATTGTLAAATVMSTAKIAALTAGAITVLSLGIAVYQHPPGSGRSSATPSTAPALSAADLSALLHPARLSPSDAAEALAAYLALPPLPENAPHPEFLERAARLRALLTILPAAHVAQLHSATATRPGDPESRLRRIAFTAWTELDAPAAARWAAALEPGPGIDGSQRAIFASGAALAWSRTDFNAAYAWATALRPGLARHIGGNLLARLVLADADRALALARAGDLAFFDAVRAPLFRAWVDHDPAAAFHALGAEMFAKPEDRAPMPDYLARWAWRDPQAALTWFDANATGETHQRSAQLVDLIIHFSNKTPPPDYPALGAALIARAETGFGSDRLEYLLRTWMSHDSAAALRWIDALSDAALRQQVLIEAAGYASRTEPEHVIELVRRISPGPKRNEAIETLLRDWSQKDPDAALAWLDSAEGTSLTGPDAARVVRIGAIARQDPAAALTEWKAIATEDTRRGAAPALARAWAATDPAAATAWLFNQIPEGPNANDPATYLYLDADAQVAYRKRMEPYWRHSHTYDTISAAWIARDPAGFVAWAESLPDAVQRSSALHSLAWGSSRNRPDPAMGLDLIAALRDPAVRDPLVRDYLNNWHAFDQTAARRWASEHEAESLLPSGQNPAR